jgi:flagellar protein FlaG
MDTLKGLAGIQSINPGPLPHGSKAQFGVRADGEAPPSGTVPAAGQNQTVGSTTKAERGGTNDKDSVPDKQHVAEAVKNMKDFLQMVRRSVQFKLDQDTGKMVIQIKDEETDKVIRQIPSEEMLKISKELDKIKGLLFEGKV